MWEYLEKDLNKTRSELEKLQKDDPSLVNELSGGYINIPSNTTN
jgi:hypothetical protein